MIWSRNCFAFAKFLSRFLALICHSYTQYFCITFLCAVVICLPRISDELGLLGSQLFFSCCSSHCQCFQLPRCYKQDSSVYSGEMHTFWQTLSFLPSQNSLTVLFHFHWSPFLPRLIFLPVLTVLYPFCLHFHLPYPFSWDCIFLLVCWIDLHVCTILLSAKPALNVD